jgi:hypothetical protein
VTLLCPSRASPLLEKSANLSLALLARRLVAERLTGVLPGSAHFGFSSGFSGTEKLQLDGHYASPLWMLWFPMQRPFGFRPPYWPAVALPCIAVWIEVP